MKKVFITILCVLFCLFFCEAEPLDVTSLTDDEVLALYKELEDEISNRGLIMAQVLVPGDYIIGDDIPEGSYFARSTGYYACQYYIFDSVENYESYLEVSKSTQVILHISMIEDDTRRLFLQEGEVISILFGEMTLSEK